MYSNYFSVVKLEQNETDIYTYDLCPFLHVYSILIRKISFKKKREKEDTYSHRSNMGTF